MGEEEEEEELEKSACRAARRSLGKPHPLLEGAAFH